MQRIKAFTLSETLITLLIIGTLVVLMLRSINRVSPDANKILFIKSYHALEAAVTNIINDSSKYDSTFMTESERSTAISEGVELHQDFRDKPYKTAEVTYINNGTQNTKSELSQSEALCYFIADQFNTLGSVACPNKNKAFQTSNGVCYGVSATNNNGSTDIYISPNCDDTSYLVQVFKDGKMTVPSGTGNQETAYNWMQSQTELN